MDVILIISEVLIIVYLNHTQNYRLKSC
jgi:hypothetical protein